MGHDRPEVQALGDRATMFLRAAYDDLEDNRFDLAVFHSEQAVQLTLKYVLAKQLGHFPHTHSLIESFESGELIRQDLYDLYKSKRYLIEVMSDAYIDRYLPRSYSRETAEALVPCARNFLSAVGLWR
ncbi:hypothetical protein B9Q04_19740 [Candidatus Marsarchaeota G2 archaeon BE_D]|jgi:Uncharacterized conserved protein related to C-terminal domain of eukaryotic chaperone, SACSIN|uniref:HEPN domain-containing protein n=1 Tax=Candidatus Marsarchaeota G2 archaeon BE_D TaxID=1978158 RepID=A0A2R6BZ33_9ARCH|nr:MAG: hypothetical protein B9Q04_19740 [Candidatus Marsarchaeota G2 archaeon BE_D]